MLPDNSRQPFFYDTISHCSAAFNAPFFTPHITLGRIPDGKTDESPRLITEIADHVHSFTFSIKDLECRPEPYQKLVLTLNPGDIFHSICNEADRYLGGNYSKSNDPHLSLLYSDLDCHHVIDKEIILRSTIPEVVEICEIAAVELQGRPEDWKILARRKFSHLQ